VTSVELSFEDVETTRILFGEQDRNLKQLEQTLDVTYATRGTTLQLRGDEHAVELGRSLMRQLYELIRNGYPVFPSDVENAVKILRRDQKANLRDVFMDAVFVTSAKKVIVPKTFNQKLYLDAVRKHDIVFGVGPAGTGKTYLAMAMALSALIKRQVRRIILTRPAVEAGERLGFLPGDMAEKVNPYLRPLHDALFDMVEMERATRWIEEGVIEVAPLAFMRGRTLNNAFVILDEAQNTTIEQMKMFLTRLGFDSKAVITGDVTQTDLPNRRRSGLAHATEILAGVEGIGMTRFSEVDVVRHPLVQKIILAYERAATSESARGSTEVSS